MKKLTILSLLFMVSSSQVFAEDISEFQYDHDCRFGGSKTISGTYEPSSGDLDVTITVEECATRRNVVVNGSVDIAGNLIFQEPEALALVDVGLENTFTVNYKNGSEVNSQCSRFVSASYQLDNRKLLGTVTSDCERNGDLTIPTYDALMGKSLSTANLIQDAVRSAVRAAN